MGPSGPKTLFFLFFSLVFLHIWRFATHLDFLNFLIRPLDHENIQGEDCGGRTEHNWFFKGWFYELNISPPAPFNPPYTA
jgi:hypothetical protein